MTSLHISVIKFMDDWEKKNYSPVKGTIGQADPFFAKYKDKFPKNYDLFEQVCIDLELKNLLEKLTSTTTEKSKTQTKNDFRSYDIKIWNLTTEGRKFLEFIADPIRIINNK